MGWRPKLRRQILKGANKVQQIQRLGLMQGFSQRDEGEFESTNSIGDAIEFFGSVYFHEEVSCG